MKGKPYIACPLEAALAAKNFGFRFIDKQIGAIFLSDLIMLIAGTHQLQTKAIPRLYIFSGDIHLLDPMVGDLCELKGNPEYDHYDLTWELILKKYDMHPHGVEFDTENSSFYRGKLQGLLNRIIQRNRKPFPEIHYEN